MRATMASLGTRKSSSSTRSGLSVSGTPTIATWIGTGFVLRERVDVRRPAGGFVEARGHAQAADARPVPRGRTRHCRRQTTKRRKSLRRTSASSSSEPGQHARGTNRRGPAALDAQPLLALGLTATSRRGIIGIRGRGDGPLPWSRATWTLSTTGRAIFSTAIRSASTCSRAPRSTSARMSTQDSRSHSGIRRIGRATAAGDRRDLVQVRHGRRERRARGGAASHDTFSGDAG